MLLYMCGCTTSKEVVSYTRVETSKAKEMMGETEHYILLDVRTVEEYNDGHIEGAINLPLDEIEEKAISTLPNLNQPIFVYCRSGNRSKTASQQLVELGYTNIIEMGGIIDWEGNIVK